MKAGDGSGDEDWSVSAPWMFRGTEYKLSADVRSDVLVVQVEETLTAERWTGHFETKHIEELTRKTGNYKQFAVFLNMLESAIAKRLVQSSDSVTLDLLTYTDLEALKNRKSSSKTRPSPAKTAKQLQAKRYLILTYSVEFDRIHYPLALSYTGKPDPATLQDTIRRQAAEIHRLKHQGTRQSSLSRLQREYDSLLAEKEELEAAFTAFQQEVTRTKEGSATKEIRTLRKVIKNLEEDIMKERTKHQRVLAKKNEEIRQMLQELDELRSSERTVKSRVKNLTNELAILKRGVRGSPVLKRRSGTSTSVKKAPSGHPKRRSSSADRQPSRIMTHSRVRTPSPSGARVPRFDPTAYVQSRRKKQQEVDHRRLKLPGSRRMRSRSNSAERPPSRSRPPSGGLGRSSNRTRTSSVGSAGSRGSSRRSSVDLSGSGGSQVVITVRDEGVRARGTSGRTTNRRSRLRAWDSPAHSTPVAARSSKTPARLDNSGPLDHSEEISEIDARLNALQQFMKRSLETAKHRNQ